MAKIDIASIDRNLLALNNNMPENLYFDLSSLIIASVTGVDDIRRQTVIFDRHFSLLALTKSP